MVYYTVYDTPYFTNRDIKTISNHTKYYIASDYEFIKDKLLEKLQFTKNEISSIKPVVLFGITEHEKDIPKFNHLLYNLENNFCVYDFRPYVVANSADSITIKNTNDFIDNLVRFKLSYKWLNEQTTDIYNLKFAHFLFAAFLSDNIAMKFSLDFSARAKVKILSIIYYARLFKDKLNSEDLEKLLIRVKDELIVQDSLVDIYEKTTNSLTIEDYCEDLYKVTDNVRLKNITPDVLISIIGNSWFGPNGKELLIASLYHPPTWVSIVQRALTDKSYNKTSISVLAANLGKKSKAQDFLKELQNIVSIEA